jgi:hypothetical protein
MKKLRLAVASALSLGLAVLVPEGAAASTGWGLQSLHSEFDGGFISTMQSVSCVAANNCMASGVNAGGTLTQFVVLAEQWNGSSWTAQNTPFPADQSGGPGTDGTAELRGVKCVSAAFCMGTGDYINTAGARETLAETWNGSTWSIIPTVNPGPSTNQLDSVACTTATNCIATGYYQNSAGTNFPLAERWNGTSWQQLAAGAITGGRLLGLSCTSASACTAVGFTESNPLAERWNGTSWKTQSVPKPSGASSLKLKGVKCVSGSLCFAVGATGNMQAATPSGSAVAERWNGTGWHVLGVPSAAGAKASELNAISCTTANSCYAVGDDYQPGQPYYPDTFPLAEHWNGTTWSVQATPFINFDGGVDNNLLGISCTSATACEAAGQYTSDNSLVAFAMGRS